MKSTQAAYKCLLVSITKVMRNLSFIDLDIPNHLKKQTTFQTTLTGMNRVQSLVLTLRALADHVGRLPPHQPWNQ